MKLDFENMNEEMVESLTQTISRVQSEILDEFLDEAQSTFKAMEQGAPKTVEKLNTFTGCLATEAAMLSELMLMTPEDLDSIAELPVMLPSLVGLHIGQTNRMIQRALRDTSTPMQNKREFIMKAELYGMIFKVGLYSLMFDIDDEDPANDAYKVVKEARECAKLLRPVLKEIRSRVGDKMFEKVKGLMTELTSKGGAS